MERLQLTPRQTRLALDLLTALVIASIATALAGLTWRLAGHAGTGAITVPGAQALPLAATGAVDTGPVLALRPFGQAAPGDNAQPTTLALELKGIIAARPAELSSAFVQSGGDPPVTVRVGDSISGATVQAIGRDRIFLMNGGRAEYLAMPDPFGRPADAAAPAGSPGTVPLPQPPTSTTPPPPAAAPPPAASLLQRYNATPTADGLRIGAGAPGGLRAGDVIASVNGQAMTDPAAAQRVLATAQASGSAKVEIVRNGQRVTLTVPTR